MLVYRGVIKALILAGGFGRELLPLTINLPKPLLPVGNFPLLLFQIYQLKKAGITEVVLSLPYQPRKIHQIFQDGTNFGVILRYHVESTPVGTAGALKVARNLIENTTVVINGDILAEIPLKRLLTSHRTNDAVVTIGTSSVGNPQAYGTVEVDAQGRVTRFIERPRGKQVRTNTINAGVYILEPEVLDWIPSGQPSFFERDLFPVLIDQKAPFFASDLKSYWTEITRPDNYLQSNMDFLDSKISLPHFAAFPKQHHSPDSSLVKVDTTSFIDKQCVIKSGTQIKHSVIGNNCRIEEETTIRNSVLWPGCRIQRGAIVSGSIVGRGCIIGEKSHVYAGNILGDKSLLTSYSKT